MAAKPSERIVVRSKAVQILKKLDVFTGLAEDEYFKVLGMCSSTEARQGETLFKQGDDGASMFILLTGEIQINVEGVAPVHTMKAGEILGEIGLVCDIKRTASAVATQDSVLLQLFGRIFHDVVRKYPHVGYVIMHNIAGILAHRLTAKNSN